MLITRPEKWLSTASLAIVPLCQVAEAENLGRDQRSPLTYCTSRYGATGITRPTDVPDVPSVPSAAGAPYIPPREPSPHPERNPPPAPGPLSGPLAKAPSAPEASARTPEPSAKAPEPTAKTAEPPAREHEPIVKASKSEAKLSVVDPEEERGGLREVSISGSRRTVISSKSELDTKSADKSANADVQDSESVRPGSRSIRDKE